MKNFFKALLVFAVWATLGMFYLKETNALTELSDSSKNVQDPNDYKYFPDLDEELDKARSELLSNVEAESIIDDTEDTIATSNDTTIYTDNSLLADEVRNSIEHNEQLTREKKEALRRAEAAKLAKETENTTVKAKRGAGKMIYPNYSYGELIVDETIITITEQIVNELENNLEAKAVIIGHTDNVGNAVDNYLIALQRARQIKWYLTNQLNISGKRISAVSKGETEPIASNGNADGRTKNNRIEIIIKY